MMNHLSLSQCSRALKLAFTTLDPTYIFAAKDYYIEFVDLANEARIERNCSEVYCVVACDGSLCNK